MQITPQDREALNTLLGFFGDCKDLAENHVDAMLIALAEHRQRASREAYGHLTQALNVYRRQSTESVGSFAVTQEVISLLNRAMEALDGTERELTR